MGSDYYAIRDNDGIITKIEDIGKITESDLKGKDLVFVTIIPVQTLKEIQTEILKQRKIAEFEKLRQEMIDLGITEEEVPPPQQVEEEIFEEEVVEEEVAPPPPVIKKKVGPKPLVTEQPKVEVIKPQFPINPSTGKPFTGMEFEMLYNEFKDQAERDERVIMVRKGNGCFIVHAGENLQLAKNHRGVPLILQGMQHR